MPQASERNVAYLTFFRRWDTPRDDLASKQFVAVGLAAPDYDTFRAMAPPDSEARKLFERFLGSFEDAGALISAGQMNEDLFFDSWYAMPRAWERARPYIKFIRQESKNSNLYRHFEWLAARSIEYWAERKRNPPAWRPLDRPMTHEDESVFAAFNATGSTARDAEARIFFTELEHWTLSDGEVTDLLQPGTELISDLIGCCALTTRPGRS